LYSSYCEFALLTFAAAHYPQNWKPHKEILGDDEDDGDDDDDIYDFYYDEFELR
jgi:hypothetical protein